MRKKLVVIFLLFFVFIGSLNASNASLKDIKDQLEKDLVTLENLSKDRESIQGKINAANAELEAFAKEIEEYNIQIEESKKKIEELKVEIDNKQKEIDNLLSFLQISEGENVYLEYVFKAKSFTDFIYRLSVVEQLTDYNDNLIDEMHALIKENEELQEELQDKIKKCEEATIKLEETLSSYGLTLSSILEDQGDIQEEIKARKAEVASYESLYRDKGCSDDESISSCLGMPYATGFIRPLNYGYISSEFGMRFHPTQYVWKMHDGVDIGGNGTGTNVYAAATGVVVNIIYQSSCGGNKVYILHNIGGTEYRTVYMHLHSINVSLNQWVSSADIIGTVGGGEWYDSCTTGPHLHFGVLAGSKGSSYLNPRDYVSFPDGRGDFYSRY